MVPARSTDAYHAVRQHAAMLDRSDRGRLLLSGADRATYLHGLLTNDIAGLTAGHGSYSAYLTPQGRMIADMFVYELGDVILMTMDGSVKDAVLAKLDQFIFSEDVKIGDVTESLAEIAVIGPESSRVIGAILAGTQEHAQDALPLHGNLRADFRGAPVIVTRTNDLGEAGFELYVDRSSSADLCAALESAGVTVIDPATAEAARIESGIPAFRRDMDEDTIPLEAGIEDRAISLTKGCYVGQEVIIRVLHRGHGRVVRRLVGLMLDGSEPPAAGAHVRAGDREVGHVTSAAMSPRVGRPVALAYVRRDFVEPGTVVDVDGVRAVVSALPFAHQ
jgi:folate-binding protein YgfZ